MQGNTATGITQFGIIIDQVPDFSQRVQADRLIIAFQSYPSTLGTPGTGVVLSVRIRLARTKFSTAHVR
jgi:hypothetical protein